MNTYILKLNEITGVSIVNDPAMEEEFEIIKLEAINYEISDDFITGPVLVPNKPFKRTINGKSELVSVKKEDIVKIAVSYLNGKHFHNLEHLEDVEAPVQIAESYITTPDKKYKNLPDGTWIMTLNVQNKELMQAIKDKVFNGFSIEAIGKYVSVALSIEPELTDNEEDIELSEEDYNFYLELKKQKIDPASKGLVLPPCHPNCKCEVTNRRWTVHKQGIYPCPECLKNRSKFKNLKKKYDFVGLSSETPTETPIDLSSSSIYELGLINEINYISNRLKSISQTLAIKNKSRD